MLDFKPADIVLVHGDGPISQLIEDVEHSPYSHTTGWVQAGELIEANGFRRTGYQAADFYAGHADVFRFAGATYEQLEKIIEYVKKEVGSRYDFLLLFLEAIRYGLHNNSLLQKWYKEPFNSRICSTLWVDAYRAVGLDPCPGIRYPSPADWGESKYMIKIGRY